MEPKKTFRGLVITSRPMRRGEDRSFEADYVEHVEVEGSEADARRELSIKADVKQGALRRHGESGVLVRYVLLPEGT